jgi:hypothetical protein
VSRRIMTQHVDALREMVDAVKDLLGKLAK